MIYSTYFGGSSAVTYALGLDVDTLGSAYVVGFTNGGLPTKNAFQTSFADTSGGSDGFLTKFTPDGTALVYSTYLGGRFTDEATAVRVDSSGNATVVGFTLSPDFPLVSSLRAPQASSEAFITRFDATGSVITFSTLLGGSGNDSAQGVALDSTGNIYVAGNSGSTDFPNVGDPGTRTRPYVARNSNQPTPVAMTLKTVPRGLQVSVDGAVVTPPFVTSWNPNTAHQIDVPLPQANVSSFAAWLNGGTQSQTVTTPNGASTLTAVFNVPNCDFTFDHQVDGFGQLGSVGVIMLSVTTEPGCHGLRRPTPRG